MFGGAYFGQHYFGASYWGLKQELSLFATVLLDAGAVYTGFTSPANPGTLLGATRGGTLFKRTPKYIETPYEGVPGDVKTKKHLVGVDVRLTVNLISLDTDNLAKAIPNSSVSAPSGGFVQLSETEWDAAGVHTLTNIAIIAQLSGNKDPVAIVLDNPISEKELNLNMRDKNESVSKVEFSAYYDESNGFDSPPWRIYWPEAN